MSAGQHAIRDSIRLVTDLRTWVAVGIFGLNFKAVDLMASHPALLKEQLFVAYVTTVAGGGLATLLAFLFGAAKATEAREARQGDGG